METSGLFFPPSPSKHVTTFTDSTAYSAVEVMVKTPLPKRYNGMDNKKTRRDCEILAKEHGLKLEHYLGQERRPDWHLIYRKMLANIANSNYGKRVSG
jgi:hypothetical protein